MKIPSGYSQGAAFLVLTIGLFLAAPVKAATVKDIATQVTNLWSRYQLLDEPKTIPLANGSPATTLIFRETTWELKNPPQSAAASWSQEKRLAKLSEEERLKLMNRYDDHIQLWLVPLDQFPRAGVGLKGSIQPDPWPNRYHREKAWLGNKNGWAYYGYMPIYHWIHLNQSLELQGGDDIVAAAAAGLMIEDKGTMTANSVEGYLVLAGDKALPYIRSAITTPKYSRAFRVLGRIPGPAAQNLLENYLQSEDPVLVRAARHTLTVYPRPEAEPLYFKWLEAEAGQKPVWDLLRTCAKVNKARLKPVLPRILASPRTHHELRQAFELSRELASRDIPANLLDAEQLIRKYGYRSGRNYDPAKVTAASQVLIQAADTEAAAHLAVSLVCARTKGSWKPANEAGISILKAIPDGQGRRLARTAAATIEEKHIRELLQQVNEDVAATSP